MIKESIVRKYQEFQAILDADLKLTLSHLEMEERAAVSALEGHMEKNWSLIQSIEQDLVRLTVAIDQIVKERNVMVRNTHYIQIMSLSFSYFRLC